MLNMGICDVCLMGLTSSLEGTSIWEYPGNWSKKKKQDRGKETLKLIITDVKQGFVWGYSGSKILGGCTREERMGYRNLERIYMYFPVFWDERFAIQKIKTGMHGLVQLDACNWWDGGIKGTSRSDMRLLCWKATQTQQWACDSDKL